MSSRELVIFLLDIAIMLSVALIFGQAARRLHLPGVVGELLGGILLGPTIFDALAPGWHAQLFPADGAVAVGREAVIKLGLLFFLFAAGLQVNLAHLRQSGLSIVWTSISGIVVPFGLGFASVLALPGLWGPPVTSNAVLFAVFIGTALSISALPVIARILMDLDLIDKPLGVAVMAAATIDDLIGWSLLAVILSDFSPDGRPGKSVWMTPGLVAVLAVVTLAIGRWPGRHLLRWAQARLPWPTGFIGVTAILVLMVASAVESVGIHAVFGAFLVGVALSQSTDKEAEAHHIVSQFVRSFFAPLYFVSIGLQANFAANFDLWLVVVVLLVACVGKVGGVSFGAWVGKVPAREALAVAFGMNARGAMGMILASVALEHRLVDERVFVSLIVMSLVTSMLSGPIMQRLLIGRAGTWHVPPG